MYRVNYLNNFNSLSGKKSKVCKQPQIKTELISIDNKQLIKPNLIIVLLYIRQKKYGYQSKWN